jgi:hypothetical protein
MMMMIVLCLYFSPHNLLLTPKKTLGIMNENVLLLLRRLLDHTIEQIIENKFNFFAFLPSSSDISSSSGEGR